ncbi:MAG TPA: CAP domain-containing protein [Mycobacteriales bacterium]|nr:CAP domain-containing protein [Mycobacteriales bacterium]
METKRTARLATAALGASVAGLLALAPAATAATAQTAAASVTRHTAAYRASHAALTSFESRIVFLTNQARAAHGLKPLRAMPGTTDVARRWTITLVEQHGLSHNPAITTQLSRAGSSQWLTVLENVGMEEDGNADTLFAAYMGSPHHRANILDPAVRFIGVGAIPVRDASGHVTTYNTMDFTDAYSTRYGANRTHAITTALTSTANLAHLVH